jgi:ABC-type antimicrobial peptide transport system permease subunit
MAYAVSQRTGEIGIRMALGASPGTVLRMILSQGLRLTFFGIGLGLVVALGLTRLMQQLLFGVQAHDPLIYVGISVLLCVVAACACWLPARRATRVDPMIALRAE